MRHSQHGFNNLGRLLGFAQVNSKASDYPTGHIDQEDVHCSSQRREGESKKIFRLHIGHAEMAQYAVGLAPRQAVQVTASEHAGLSSKHASPLRRPE